MDFYDKCRGAIFRPGAMVLTERAVDFCKFNKNAVLADIGGGTGETARLIKERFSINVINVEPSLAMRGDNASINAAAENTPFDKDSLDGVLFECTLSLCESVTDALNEMRRILKRGGYLIVSDVYSKTASAKTAGAMKWLYEINTVTDVINDAGFDILLLEDHSRELVKMKAKLIMEGAEDEVFECLCGINNKNIGYYLLIARKK